MVHCKLLAYNKCVHYIHVYFSPWFISRWIVSSKNRLKVTAAGAAALSFLFIAYSYGLKLNVVKYGKMAAKLATYSVNQLGS